MAASETNAPARRHRWLRLLPLAGPVVVFTLLGWVMMAPEPAAPIQKLPPPPNQPPPPPTATTWQELDLSATTPQGVLDGWIAEQGAFVLRPDSVTGEPLLEQKPEPMTEGIYRSWTRFSHGGIRVRVSGEAHRRAPPRFSIGLEGRRALHLRASPAHRRLELITPPEVTLAATTWEWQKDRKLWLELVCLPGRGTEVQIEARAWAEGDPRPTEPTLALKEDTSPGRLSPSIRGGPFALKSLFTDQIAILKLD